MKKLLLPFFASVLLLSSCIDGEDPKPFFYGLTTVEKNILGALEFHTDKGEEGRIFKYKAINNVDPNNKLNEGDRVYMSCTVEKDYSNNSYDATITSCSLNLSKPVQKNPAAPEKLEDVFIDVTDGYLSTDSRGRQFLNLAVRYSTKNENGDVIMIAYFDADQVEGSTDTVVLRLKHYQKDKVGSTPNVNDVLSASIYNMPLELGGAAVTDRKFVVKWQSYDGIEMSKEFSVKK